MASSLSLSSPSFTKRVNVGLHSKICKTRAVSTTVCAQNQKFSNSKLYLIPPHRFASKTFACVDSVVEENSAPKQQKYVAFCDVSAPRDSQSASNIYDSIASLEIQLQELFNEIKNLIKMGNTSDAVYLLEANYEAVKEEIDAGSKGIEQVAILDIIALGFMAVGDLKLVQLLLDTINGLAQHLKDDEPLLDSILMHLASMYSYLEKFDKALIIYRRIVDIRESRYGKNSTLLVTPLLGMAKVFGFTGRSTKAIELYNRAITILEIFSGAESEILVTPLSSLGNFLIKEGKGTDAEIPFARIVKIYTKLYGEKDGKVGIAMSSLALAMCAQGDANKAIDLYKNALRIIKDSNYMALDDNIMDKMRIDLAELLHTVGRGKEGRELLEECLFISEKFNGKYHPRTISHLLNLATSYSSLKNFVEAERLLRTCLDIMNKTVGPEDQSISFPMLQLAVTLYQLNRDEEAEPLAREALRIREKAFGKESLPVGEALDCLVSIQARLGEDNNKLVELLKRVLKIQEKELGYESKEVMVSLQKIVFYLDKLENKNEKLAIQRRLSMLRKKYKEAMNY